MRNPFDNTPPQPPRSIVSLPIQLLYALFSSYPLFTVPLLSLSLSLVPSAFNPSPPPLPDSPCSAGGVTPLARSFSFQYHREDLVLSVLHLYYAQRKKADTDSPCGSLLLYFDRA